MKLAGLLVAVFAAFSALGQQAPPAASTGSSPQVIFSRSLNSNSPGSNSPNGPAQPDAQTKARSSGAPVTDAERRSITFVAYDLDVRLQPKQQAISVRARMVLRNDGEQPLRRLPLQISGSLTWTSIRIEDMPAVFDQYSIDSDADHTGSLKEAAIALPQPLAAKQTISLEVTYQGTIGLSARRLEQVGAPADRAEHSDWDRVTSDFIGLRGFGNVVWYPVAAAPVALGDGNKFFAEVARQRLRQSSATVSMRITEEFWGEAPNLAILDGTVSAVALQSLPSASLPGIATCAFPKSPIGFVPPSLFLLSRTETGGDGLKVFARPEDVPNAEAYQQAATLVAPLVTRWLGSKQGSKHPSGVTIVDLPEAEDASFEQGPVLFLSAQGGEPERLAGILVYSFAHARFRSHYPWLEEGVAAFMGSMWVEQKEGRGDAIAQMDNSRVALSLAEPADPASHGADAGESLLAAKDAIYYRTKATYVLWMLRDLAGGDALAQAFQAYNPAADEDGTEFERVLEQASGKDLKWFFSDWVYRDCGLPDLSIAGVYPAAASIPGSYIVAVDVRNSGDAAAEVPVSVRSATGKVTYRLRVPAKSSISHRFLLSGLPVEVAVNDGTVPEAEASVHQLNIPDKPQ